MFIGIEYFKRPYQKATVLTKFFPSCFLADPISGYDFSQISISFTINFCSQPKFFYSFLYFEVFFFLSQKTLSALYAEPSFLSFTEKNLLIARKLIHECKPELQRVQQLKNSNQSEFSILQV